MQPQFVVWINNRLTLLITGSFVIVCGFMNSVELNRMHLHLFMKFKTTVIEQDIILNHTVLSDTEYITISQAMP